MWLGLYSLVLFCLINEDSICLTTNLSPSCILWEGCVVIFNSQINLRMKSMQGQRKDKVVAFLANWECMQR